MHEVLISKWNGEDYNPAWKCWECRKVATVVRDGFTARMETRYICIDCLEGRVNAIKKAILDDKLKTTET